MYSNSHVPSNPDEQHYFDGSDEHFPVSAECSDLKKGMKIYISTLNFLHQLINANLT